MTDGPLASPTPTVQYESLAQLDEQIRSRTPSQSTTVSNTTMPHYEDDKVIFQMQSLSLHLSTLKYTTYLIIGIALLWPWNCFLSASQYFMTKFSSSNGSTTLSDIYTSTMMTVSTLSSLIFNSYLSTKQLGTNYSRRVTIGIIINLIIFAILSFLEFTFPSLASMEYFVFIMLLVLFSSIGTCFQQNGTLAIVNILGPQYAQAAMVGQAIAGVLPSISLIFSNLSTSAKIKLETVDVPVEENKSIVIYFGMTCLVVMLSGLLFFVVNKYENVNDLLRRHNTARTTTTQTHINDQDYEDLETSVESDQTYIPFMQLFYKLKYIALSIFSIFVITLTFPIFASNISSINKGPSDSLVFEDAIFIPFVFFIWNLGDLVGRVLCSYPSLVIHSDISLFYYSLFRALLIPLFFVCNLHEAKPAVIKSDSFYLILQFMFGLTNGHCLSCCFMNVSSYVDTDGEKKAAGGFSTIFLSLGLLFGSLVSYSFVGLVK